MKPNSGSNNSLVPKELTNEEALEIEQIISEQMKAIERDLKILKIKLTK